MVCALSDINLIRKLLAMNIEATTTEMLAVYHICIVIINNMSSMGLATEAINATQKTTMKPFTCGNCTKCHTSSKGLHLSQMSEDWTMEAEMQDLKKTAPGARKPSPPSLSQCRPGG